jgi:hypothetical protein
VISPVDEETAQEEDFVVSRFENPAQFDTDCPLVDEVAPRY